MKKITYSIIILLLLSIVFIIINNKKGTSPSYLTYKPRIGQIVRIEKLSGSLFPSTQIELKSRLSGILEEYYVCIGQKIKKGQSIARIKIIPDPQSIEQAKINNETNKVKFNLQESIHKRQLKLFNEGVISQSDMESETSEFLLIKNEYATTQKLYEIALKGYTSKDSIISDTVKATAYGTIVDLPLNIGSNIIMMNNYNEGTTLATIADLDHYIFRSNLNEVLIPKIKLGSGLLIHVNSLPNIEYKAKITKISPIGIKNDGIVNFNIEASIDNNNNNNDLLRPGFSGVADLTIESSDYSLIIQEKDILFNNDSIFVKILNKNEQIEKKQVRVGMSDGIKTSIVSGLDSTSLIIKQ